MPPVPVITFRGLDPSAALEDLVLEKAAKLLAFHREILRMEVLIEEPHRSHAQGNHFHVRVEIHVPGDAIVATRDTPTGAAEDAFFAVTRAFEVALRRLEDWLDRLRDARREPRQPRGRVSRGQ